jgi:D-alanyl-D-alanine carboxypeptidase (penicillin-binding protein 5/6)
MNDYGNFDQQQQATPRRELSEEERRLHLEKRIKELRRRKRKEQRRSNRRTRLLIIALLVLFFTLFFLSSIYLLASSGESERYLSAELPASNLEGFDDIIMKKGDVAEPAISATAAFLMDPETGDILYEKNADQSLPMASTTKIMTAVVVLENASMNESTCISEYASAVGESSVWLEEGEFLTVEQLLYALMVQSANDAAVALAECVGGSEDAFVEMMNETASEIGLENTHFANPHGLDEQGHYSSARDLAITAAYAMKIPQFRSLVVADDYQIPWPGNPYPRVLENHNKLLEMYPYATGIKTGYTLGAGKCLVASAAKEENELISVILDGGESYWDQTISLMEYGFNDFTHVEYAYSGQPLASVEVGDFPRREVAAVGSQDLVFTVRRDRLEDYESASIHYMEWVPYPVEAGQEIGYMQVAEGTAHEQREPLVSDAYRNTPSFIIRVLSFIVAVFALWWKCILWLIPGL